jgi:hypothetical protein
MRALWLLPLAALTGCLDSLPPEDPGQQQQPIARGACTQLEGMTFRSLSEGECGLTPDGVATCTWHIKFDTYDGSTKTRFTWSHSDVGESGLVTCDGGTLKTVDSTFTYQGTFDEQSLGLTWDGAAYTAN